MSEYKVISRAEDVCRCDWKMIFGQMEKMDPGSAKRMLTQFLRLEELCGKYRAEELAGKDVPGAETSLLNVMNKMGDIMADFVFEQKDSDTAEMAGLFARLGYAEGDEECSRLQLRCLRDFGYNGNIEQMFEKAGEMSDEAIPVMEAFHSLQDTFSFRENGDMEEYSKTGLLDGTCLKKVKKCCSLYLDTPGAGNTREQIAVRNALTLTEKAENLSAVVKTERKRMSFADILREEKFDQGARLKDVKWMQKRAYEPHIDTQEKERAHCRPEKSQGNRSM